MRINKMNEKKILKQINDEIKTIEENNDVSGWDFVSADRMDGEDAYDCGAHFAFNLIKKWIENKDK